jgi:hypothetical protein
VVSETATWISGPKFAAWLRERKVENKELPVSRSSQLGQWERGENISVWRADRVLTHLGYHLWQLPEDVWLPNYDRLEKAHAKRSESRTTRRTQCT